MVSFAKLLLLLALVQFTNTFVPITEEEIKQYEAAYKEIEDLPVIKRFWKLATEQCQVVFSDQIQLGAPNILDKCAAETGFDYKNTPLPGPEYVGSLLKMSEYPRGFDKCFTWCTLNGFNDLTGKQYESTLLLKITKLEEVSIEIFHTKLTSTQWISAPGGPAAAAWFSVTGDAKTVNRNHTKKPILDEHEDFWCFVAELHGYFIYHLLGTSVTINEKNEQYHLCLKNIPPLEIDNVGPPFVD